MNLPYEKFIFYCQKNNLYRVLLLRFIIQVPQASASGKFLRTNGNFLENLAISCSYGSCRSTRKDFTTISIYIF